MTYRHAAVLAAHLLLLPCAAASAQDTPPHLDASADTGPGTVPGSAADWSGPYLGIAFAAPQGGNAWRQASSGFELVPDSWGGNAVVLSLGHDWQHHRLTYGARLDYGIGSHVARPRDADFINCSGCATEIGRLVTLTGRIGFATGRSHLFAEGGWARGSVEATYLNGLLTYADADMTGWALALGAERRISDRLSLTVRYDHIDLGAQPLPDYLPTGETRVEIGRMQIGMTTRW